MNTSRRRLAVRIIGVLAAVAVAVFVLLDATATGLPDETRAVQAHVADVLLARNVQDLQRRYPQAELREHIRVARLGDGAAYYIKTVLTGSFIPGMNNVSMVAIWLATLQNHGLQYRYIGQGGD